MWTSPEEDPRVGGGGTDERSVLLEYLRNYRLTLRLKCEGLDADQLARRSVPPSSLSLLGLLRHLTGVEVVWFRQVLGGEDVARPYRESGDPESDFTGAVADEAVVAEAWRRWGEEVAHAEAVMAEVHDLDRVVRRGDDELPVRDLLVHMVEEYARHVGHADLLRECVDGRVGQ